SDLRELLDPLSIENLERQLQRLVESQKIKHADALHDLLLRLGDLTEPEIEQRSIPSFREWINQLQKELRIVRIQIGKENRWIAAEDAARYRDALGVRLPKGLPEAFLEPSTNALEELTARYARAHGPFQLQDIVNRWKL